MGTWSLALAHVAMSDWRGKFPVASTEQTSSALDAEKLDCCFVADEVL